MRGLSAIGLSILLASTAAWAAPPAALCRAPLPEPAPRIEALPFAVIARAAVPTVDEKTLLAPPHEKEGDQVVSDCRGDEVVTGYLDIKPPKAPGQLSELGRQKLGDGRLVVWLESGADLGAPATLLHGFVAIVRIDGANLVVDAIGPWENGEDAKRSFRKEKIGTGPIWVEPTGHTGTGGGTDSTGLAVWVEKKGRLRRTGGIELDGLDEDLGTAGAHWRLKWKSSVAYEDSVHLTEKQTWTLVKGNHPEVARTTADRYFVVDGEQLNEVPAPTQRKPPHAADAPNKHVTVSANAGNGELRLTFDTARIPEETVNQVADLAPEANPDGISVVVAARNDGRAEVEALRKRVVPPELEPIKAWMVRSAAFTEEMQERVAGFLKSGDGALLTRGIDVIDPATACAPVLAKLGANTDAASRKQIADYDWHNCMNDKFQDKRGDYPKAAWKQFLEAYGIKSKFIPATGD
jgi:hypothetical protein